MGNGYITVNVYGSVNALPISGAKIIISDKNGNVISELLTNANGTSSTVTLEAPSVELSLDQTNTKVPYATYDIYIDKDGYHDQNTLGVQVFDGETSILPVNLTPLLQRETESDGTVTYNVGSNALLINERSQPKPFILPRVLKEVVIPSYITVHLGTPNSTATNVRIPFIDYIKNVASHEIYPTWPEQSLTANIYCQITFAINRVYTEWYTSRGYAFNITNSTAYDQYYVNGGSIFKSVSDIVDKIFNQYVRRKGFKDPYFTEYCSGTTVTCNGLSQWGTVSLADRGLNAIEILRSYYPNDIEIVESNNIATIPESYPGSPLTIGSSGSDVETVQKYLNRIRANFPLIPFLGTPDGVYGNDTKNAVQVFQSFNYLTETGIVDKATWYKISYIYVAVTKIAELISEGERIGIGDTPPTSVISQGSRGQDVLQLQFILNVISKYYNAVSPVTESNIFDDLTRVSVMEFQKYFGLTHDGIVGPTTWNKLYDVYKGIESNGNLPDTSNPSQTYPGTLLKVGSSGANVKLMQEYLNSLSNVYTSIPKLTVDGIFGNATKSAVTAFQKIFGLSQDGIIGQITWNKIVSEYNKLSTGGGTSYPGSLLKVGSSGSNVRLIQQYLNSISNIYTSIPKLTVDGVFGNATKSAVIAFQKIFGLSQDGIIGQITWNKIVEIYNNPATNNLTYPGVSLSVGLQSNNVKIMQQYLNVIRTKYPSIPVLTADGIYGNATKSAVTTYQRLFGLTADGIIGPATWNSIVSTYNGIINSRSIDGNYLDDISIPIDNLDEVPIIDNVEIPIESTIETPLENMKDFENIEDLNNPKDDTNDFTEQNTSEANIMNTMRTLVFTGMLLNRGFQVNNSDDSFNI